VYAGLLGLLVGALRTMAVSVMAEENASWVLNESWIQAGMLGLGVAGLFVLGLAPQALMPFISNLPSIFEHIGQ
jgi:hypothetical protein